MLHEHEMRHVCSWDVELLEQMAERRFFRVDPRESFLHQQRADKDFVQHETITTNYDAKARALKAIEMAPNLAAANCRASLQ
jgi:hypothetical protein